MAQITQVFLRGNALTPQRFWDFALRTETKHARFYDDISFHYSEKHTQEYLAMSEDNKKKVQFTYINGVKQKY